MTTIITSLDDLHEHVRTWYGKSFAFDYETSGVDAHHDRVLGCAFAFEDGDSCYVALAHTVPDLTTNPPTYPLVEFISESAFADAIRGIFAQPQVVAVAHNSKFELHFTQRLGLTLACKLADTMLAAKLIDENRSVSLKELAPQELGVTMPHYQDLVAYPGFPKDAILAVPLERAAEYAELDAVSTWRLWERYRTALVDEGLDLVFRDIWMPLVGTLQEMESRGIVVDLDLVREAKSHYSQLLHEHERAVWREGVQMVINRYGAQIPSGYLRMATQDEIEQCGDDGVIAIDGIVVPLVLPSPRSKPRVPHFNTGSNKHLGELLYDYLGIAIPKDVQLKRNQDGTPSVDSSTLRAVRYFLTDDQSRAREIIDHILGFRKAAKMLGTYIEPFIEIATKDPEHAVRTNFNQAVTATGRLSSSSPLNLQTIPSRGEEGNLFRQMFRARPGHKLVVADFTGMELALLAHYSGDDSLMSGFMEGKDLHLVTASTQAGLSYDDLKAQYEAGDPEAKRQRMLGKVANFCVPLSSLCLTRSGWKRYDEIQPGVDETYGVNPTTGNGEWTRIKRVHFFADAQLMRITSPNGWSAVTTPDHRWFVSQLSQPGVTRFTTTAGLGGDDEIIRAVPMADRDHLAATPDEAEMVFWIAAAHQDPRGPVMPNHQVVIRQNRHDCVERIDRLLALLAVPHDRRSSQDDPEVDWVIDPGFLQRLVERFAIDRLTIVEFVLRLNPSALRGLITTMQTTWLGERFHEVLALLLYLVGDDRTTIPGQTITKHDAGHGPVWCVETDLGTWTMRQGDQISLTGNSLSYGMGAHKLQATLLIEHNTKVTLEEAQHIIDSYNATYSGSNVWKSRVIRFVRRHGYVQTLAKRKRRLPEAMSHEKMLALRAERQAVNAVIQGGCADIMAAVAPLIQNALRPLGGSLLLIVHDEVVAEVPSEFADAASKLIEAFMNDYVNHHFQLKCPMHAEAGVGDTWKEAKS